MKKLSADELEMIVLAVKALKGPNVSVAGGVLAFQKYVDAVTVIEWLATEVLNDHPEFQPAEPTRKFTDHTGQLPPGAMIPS